MKQENQVTPSTTNTAAREYRQRACPGCGMPIYSDGLCLSCEVDADTLTQQQGGEQDAREWLAREYEDDPLLAERVRAGTSSNADIPRAIRAITAALRTKQPAASEGDVELSVLEAIEREMLYIAPEMKRPDLANGLDLVPNFYDALKAMFTSKQAAGEAVAGLMELADRYFSIGYAQGMEGRKTDSPAFDALECRYEIESRIAAYTTPPRHPADEGRDALCIHCGRPTMHIGNVCFTCSKAAKNALQAGTP